MASPPSSGTSRPLTSWAMTSGLPPTAEAITGAPAAMASSMTCDSPS
jgi:hypothetical protein